MKQELFTKLYVGLFTGIAVMLMVLFYYFTDKTVEAENRAKVITAHMSSQALVDKLDRAFYERYGDVQAFAYNQLAVQALEKKSNTPELQRFINQMTQYYALYDLMILCDKEGSILAINTQDRNHEAVNTQPLLGKNMREEEWFQACMWGGNQKKPWYSDFEVNLYVASVYQNKGDGMAFAAPVKNSQGEIQGVWYNFANWQETTGQIVQETEAELRKTDPKARIFLTNRAGRIIYASDPAFIQGVVLTPTLTSQANASFFQKGTTYTDDFVTQWSTGKGAYTFAGNQWKAATLLSRSCISIDVFWSGKMLMISCIVLLINALMIFATYMLARRSTRQLRYIAIIRHALEQIARGAVVRIPAAFKTKDEIGQIGQSISILAEALKAKTVFSDEIARGNLDVELTGISTEDMLGNSLLNMRTQLKKTHDEQLLQNWTTQGVNQMLEILNNATDINELSQQVVTLLIQYLNANQGAIFIAQNEKKNTYLKMTACYAYGRKKFFEEAAILRPGQGLAGQAYLERTYIYLEEVPENYIQITSGLGESVPRCILIMPLLTNEGVEGVIEIASLFYLKKYEIDFVQKVAENIAFTLRNKKYTQQVVALLEESQSNTEMMHAQEEEMRQNMEEMVAIQEELHRKEKEAHSLLEGITNACIMIEFTMTGQIIATNENFVELFGYTAEEIEGKHHCMFVEEDYADSQEYHDFWTDIQTGNIHTSTLKRYKKDGTEVWLHATYAPIFTAHGEPIKVIKLAMDVTQIYLLKNEVDYKANTMDAYEQEMEKVFRELEMNYELVEAYEDEMKHVFTEMQAYAARLTELEGRSVPAIPVRK